MAAITERWLLQLPRTTGEAAAAGGAPVPAVASIGGMPDSCYMWRSGGPMLATRRMVPDPRGDG